MCGIRTFTCVVYLSGPKKLQLAFRARVRGVRATAINRRRHRRRRRVRARLAAKVHRFTRSRPTDDDRATVTHCCALRYCLSTVRAIASAVESRFRFFKPFPHLPLLRSSVHCQR